MSQIKVIMSHPFSKSATLTWRKKSLPRNHQSLRNISSYLSHLLDRVQLRPHPSVCGDRHHCAARDCGGEAVEHQGAAILLLKQDAGWDNEWKCLKGEMSMLVRKENNMPCPRKYSMWKKALDCILNGKSSYWLSTHNNNFQFQPLLDVSNTT